MDGATAQLTDPMAARPAPRAPGRPATGTSPRPPAACRCSPRPGSPRWSAGSASTWTRAWSANAAQLDRVCRYAVLPGNKLFRPMLLLESAAAVGGDIEQVLPAAAGAEAGHVASLIHDDIIDGDVLRRGRPSVQVGLRRG